MNQWRPSGDGGFCGGRRPPQSPAPLAARPSTGGPRAVQPSSFTGGTGSTDRPGKTCGKNSRCILASASRATILPKLDRKSVVEGKSVSVRVDLGGRRIIKKKKSIADNKALQQRT